MLLPVTEGTEQPVEVVDVWTVEETEQLAVEVWTLEELLLPAGRPAATTDRRAAPRASTGTGGAATGAAGGSGGRSRGGGGGTSGGVGEGLSFGRWSSVRDSRRRYTHLINRSVNIVT